MNFKYQNPMYPLYSDLTFQPEQTSFGSMVHVPFYKQRVENSPFGWYPSLHLNVMGSFLWDIWIMAISVPLLDVGFGHAI